MAQQEFSATPGTHLDVRNTINSNAVDTENRITSLETGGVSGDSAYEVAVSEGFVGDETTWLASLNGSDGSDGANGTNGTSGVDGANGAAGTDGTNGIDGTNGVDGVNGADGAAGTNGTNGIDGTNGTNGSQGIQGEQGNTGVDGTNGTNGTNGSDGIQGIQGEQGSAGSAGTGVTFKGDVPTIGDLPLTATEGDAYIVQADDSFHIYDGAAFVSGGSIQGPQGIQGIEGDAGTNGINGTNGTNGTNGSDGIQGEQGNIGVDGTNGTNGVDGVNGADGIAGTNGVDGANGADGQGVPTGGTIGQALVKLDGTDYNAEWADAGGGGTDIVESASATNPALIAKEDTPYNDTVAGLTRGSQAVDLQLRRQSNIDIAGGNMSVIAGGDSNEISSAGAGANGQYSTIIGGGFNKVLVGQYSTVLGGYLNQINPDAGNANYSVVCGAQANAKHARSFVFNDSEAVPFTSLQGNTFNVHASNGLRLVTDGAQTANQVLTCDADGHGTWQTTAAADVSYDNTASGLTATDVKAAIDEVAVSNFELSGDLSPELSGNLKVNNQKIVDSYDREILEFEQPFALDTAENHFAIRTASTGGHPAFKAVGTSSDINIDLQPKGLGVVNVTGPFGIDIAGGKILKTGTNIVDLIANGNVSNISLMAHGAGNTLANPEIGVTSSNANQGLTIKPKGTGKIKLGFLQHKVDDAPTNANDGHVLTYNSTDQSIKLEDRGITDIKKLNRQVTHVANTWYALGTNGNDPQFSTTDRLILNADTSCVGRAMIVGRNDDGSKSFAFELLFSVVRNSTTYILKSEALTIIDNSDDTTYSARVSIDQVSGIKIEVSSTASTDTIEWAAQTNIATVTY